MTDCLTTTESFIIQDMPEFEDYCPVCCKKTKQRITYVSVFCLECRGEHGPDYTKGMVAAQRRSTILKMDRKTLAKILGVKTSTLRRYEHGAFPEHHFKKLEELICQQVQPLKQ